MLLRAREDRREPFGTKRVAGSTDALSPGPEAGMNGSAPLREPIRRSRMLRGGRSEGPLCCAVINSSHALLHREIFCDPLRLRATIRRLSFALTKPAHHRPVGVKSEGGT